MCLVNISSGGRGGIVQSSGSHVSFLSHLRDVAHASVTLAHSGSHSYLGR